MEEATVPEIKQPPSMSVASLLTPINLTCIAEGRPAPSYEWYRDGVVIPGEIRSFLYIPETSPQDRGSYYCKAINNINTTESKPASLLVPGVRVFTVACIISRCWIL